MSTLGRRRRPSRLPASSIRISPYNTPDSTPRSHHADDTIFLCFMIIPSFRRLLRNYLKFMGLLKTLMLRGLATVKLNMLLLICSSSDFSFEQPFIPRFLEYWKIGTRKFSTRVNCLLIGMTDRFLTKPGNFFWQQVRSLSWIDGVAEYRGATAH